jgi:hypothetical protein
MTLHQIALPVHDEVRRECHGFIVNNVLVEVELAHHIKLHGENGMTLAVYCVTLPVHDEVRREGHGFGVYDVPLEVELAAVRLCRV